MNANWAPALIGLIGTVFLALIPLVIWYLRRHDSVAEQMREQIALIDDLRRDFWDLEDYIAQEIRPRWRQLQQRWIEVQGQLKELEVIDTIEELENLPALPDPRVSRHRDDEMARWFRRHQGGS